MNRSDMLARVSDHRGPWDVLVIGGGATGVGVAVDAASRGYDTVLLEQSDFGKGTSSRSTKLIHGGVRYLQQGNVSLVLESLKERGILRDNAPHLVHDLRFIVPNYDWWEAPFYGIGMKVYDALAGKYGFGPSRILSRDETLSFIPTLKTDGLRGGVQYFDGQFDDARLLIALARTAARQGAALVNYARVDRLVRGTTGFVEGVIASDLESGTELELRAKVVINATGPFTDAIRRMDDPSVRTIIAPSQGVHLVLDRSFLSGDSAIMVPHTRDGRVMFAIPWHGHALVGTTDTPVTNIPLDPVALPDEIEFIIDTAGDYLQRPPTASDILSVFAGIRPLVQAGGEDNTAELSRDHTLLVAQSGLITICGGKWTTYRLMAEECVTMAATIGGLEEQPCVTRELRIHGYHQHADKFGTLEVYGADAPALEDLMRGSPDLQARLNDDLPYRAGEVVWAVRHEMARTVEDVLSRRTRSLPLDARAAIAMAPAVASLMAAELGRDAAWEAEQVEAFTTLAVTYLP
ncbi:MAG: glycerol-3-phosphate dehydrogenase/oxidase [Gemmatimonadetes bacterium]|nr:glycerol-3-phosphate dehydrogenase/oxidase [Gemmatimonadota bacterium]